MPSSLSPTQILKCIAISMALLLSACSTMESTKQEPIEQTQTDQELASTQEVPTTQLADPLQPNLSMPLLTAEQQEVYQQAIAAMKKEQWQQAQQNFEKLNESKPLSSSYYHLGIIALKQDNLDAATAHFDLALEVNENNYFAHNQLAILYRQRGDFLKAESHLSQALNIWPDFATAHYNLGILYELYTGKLSQALEHYQRYQELQDEPDSTVTMWIADLSRRTESEE